MMSTQSACTGDAAASKSALESAQLPHLGTLQFTGPGAIDFLQGQVSNDTRRLAAGSPLLAAYSSAQGRVIAVLHLLPHSSGVIALLPRDVLATTAERLRKFVLRAKVKIEDASDRFAVIGVRDTAALTAAGLEVPDPRGYLEREGIGIARVEPAGSATPRFWLIREAAAPREGAAPRQSATPRGPAHADIETAWRLADIRAGLPSVYAATSEAFVAQMLNLDLLDGISFSKGCYTGQEIIARTQHLGRIKRRMYRLRLPAGDWSIGGSVSLADGRTGRLVEIARTEGHAEALAVLSLEPGASTQQDAAPGTAAAAQAVELPLPYAFGAP
jgi:tRNA-modifying protein YgfZ